METAVPVFPAMPSLDVYKRQRDELLVNQVAAEAAEGTAEADISTAEAGETLIFV